MAKLAVLWFRNDLRLRDNQLFHYQEIRAALELVAVYCIDPRHFKQSRWGDHSRTGPHRARFLAESLLELEQSLKSIGSKLLVVDGRPEDVIPRLLGEQAVLAYQQEDTFEEQLVEKRVLERVHPSTAFLQHRHHTLLNRDDLGWDPQSYLPMPYGKYWHGECQTVQPRAELPKVKPGDLPSPPKHVDSIIECPPEMTALATLMGFAVHHDVNDKAEFVWHGGEVAAHAQMAAYATSEGLGTHMQTRNKFHGPNSFSRLSPWLANGCLSPRTVYWWVSDYFKRNKVGDPRFDHFHKYVFQLCWRDYFRFYCAHFGAPVFFLEGPAVRKRPWKRDEEIERKWKEGQTGVPIVDALMRELRATGYMSNRGRYLVASFLIFYLGIDWRIGADWFETCLIDHDVCSNYGEWASMANVAVDLGHRYPMGLKGRGPSDGRDKGRNGGGGDPWAKGANSGDAVFDPWEQAVQYDRNEEFVRRWVPEVAHLPKGQAHNPPNLNGEYPRPLAVHAMTLSKSSAKGCKEKPYGPYYSGGHTHDCQTRIDSKFISCVDEKHILTLESSPSEDIPLERKMDLTLDELSAMSNGQPGAKQKARQPQCSSQTRATKVVRRWAPKSLQS